jgi:hypothetical protein
MPRGARISAFFCSPRDHTPQNSWCAFTVRSFHTAWIGKRHSLSRHQAQAQRRHTQRSRPGLPRRLPSASPKHAPNSKSLSGTIWAIDAPSQAPKPFRTCHKSSSQQRNRPDRHEFYPSYYVLLSSIAAEPSRNVSLWAQSFRHLVRPLRQLSGSKLPLTPFAAGGPQLGKCPCLR